MALVQDHALRRRAGLASNPIAMARTGHADGVERVPPLTCPVRGCSAEADALDPEAVRDMDFHIVTAHPRSRHADTARDRYRPHEEEDVD